MAWELQLAKRRKNALLSCLHAIPGRPPERLRTGGQVFASLLCVKTARRSLPEWAAADAGRNPVASGTGTGSLHGPGRHILACRPGRGMSMAHRFGQNPIHLRGNRTSRDRRRAQRFVGTYCYTIGKAMTNDALPSDSQTLRSGALLGDLITENRIVTAEGAHRAPGRLAIAIVCLDGASCLPCRTNRRWETTNLAQWMLGRRPNLNGIGPFTIHGS